VVKYVQCDLTRQEHVDKAFKLDEGKFDYIVNLCGETRFGLPEDDYKRKCVVTAEKCAEKAKEVGITKWVEMSTGQVYVATKHASKEEDSKIEPWTNQAVFRYEAENKVKDMGLPVVILRPVYVYGAGDLTGLTPRVATAAAYKQLKETMKFLWTADLKMHVVHVNDVVKAIWLACTTLESGTVFNLSDSSDLDQGKLNEMLGDIFHIKTGFQGSIASKLAETVSLEAVADHANQKHLPAWQEICTEHNIINTPISPYIDKELLYNQHLSVDGTAITKKTDFKYEVPNLNKDILKEQIDKFIANKLFPPII